MQDIKAGDLVKYNKDGEGEECRGAWLVLDLNPTQPFGELATIVQGTERRLCHISYLIKI